MIETHKDGKFSWEAEIETLRQQLAASQAREAQLREATECLLHLCDIIGAPDGPVLDKARQALALPQDTTALEAMVKEAGEVMRVRTVGVCLEDNYDLHGYIPSIRALPGVTMEDLQ